MKYLCLVALAAVASVSAQADDQYKEVRDKLVGTLGLTVTTIEPAPVPGLLQALTNRGLFYVTEDGKYLLHGRVFNLDAQMRNETEETLAKVRLEGLKDFTDSAIEFKADKEKYKVTVFTDTTCGYCRKLHSQIDEYNDLGITVRYLAFPRGGVGSEGFSELMSVWCANNPQKALTDAKAGMNLPSRTCQTKVSQQYNFGQQIGIQGTPAIILDDGSLIPGYQPPQDLKNLLDDIHS
ncbi:bifunctional protein-disulfide isomerase/oxidoreductase DsbC [Bowmanella dokdonensis]|uniref:Thiol:disulfide interchange protein n=1 Tax=Bowmanella dokdonensis TaxID=751969 RepID=A0A939INN0_9ALTE|nr:bifunctional protein-disulfide isomerase/oxidoreductase DsbC [Bowmanella dokdonensis]MBN7826528.1 bifunctional protein-disulfide isomerase/oxidoreductase DsbC [Bowmanella dokdonensis]